MTHKLISLFIATFLTTSLVAASGLTISGVYYDPVQAESGGEAIQLENTGDSPIALDSITLVTKQSSFPLSAAILLPGQGYLVADTGWSGPTGLRDNMSWPDADQEVGLSLSNTAGFVALVDENNTELDRLEWNSSNGSKAREGYLFTQAGESLPWFRNSKSVQLDVPATIIVQDAVPSILNVSLTDDAPDTPGIQLLSFARMVDLTVTAEDPNGDAVNVTVEWFGDRYTLSLLNGTAPTMFHVALPFTPQTPNDYSAVISVTDANNTIETNQVFTVLSSTSITTSGSLRLSGEPGASVSGSFTVTNEGNVAKTVSLQHSIPGAACDTTTVLLAPDESRDVTCTATIPHSAAGSYDYIIHLVAS